MATSLVSVLLILLKSILIPGKQSTSTKPVPNGVIVPHKPLYRKLAAVRAPFCRFDLGEEILLQILKVIVMVMAACCLAKPVSAEGGPSITVDGLQQQMTEDMPGFVGFVMGAAQLSDANHPRDFCIPPGMMKDIPGRVAQYMKGMYLAFGIGGRTREFGRSNAAVMVVIALNSAFPCPP